MSLTRAQCGAWFSASPGSSNPRDIRSELMTLSGYQAFYTSRPWLASSYAVCNWCPLGRLLPPADLDFEAADSFDLPSHLRARSDSLMTLAATIRSVVQGAENYFYYGKMDARYSRLTPSSLLAYARRATEFAEVSTARPVIDAAVDLLPNDSRTAAVIHMRADIEHGPKAVNPHWTVYPWMGYWYTAQLIRGWEASPPAYGLVHPGTLPNRKFILVGNLTSSPPSGSDASEADCERWAALTGARIMLPVDAYATYFGL